MFRVGDHSRRLGEARCASVRSSLGDTGVDPSVAETMINNLKCLGIIEIGKMVIS